MKYLRNRLLLSSLFLSITLVCSAQLIHNRIVATIKNEPITLLDVKHQWLLVLAESETPLLPLVPTDRQLREILDQMIDDYVLRTHAEEKALQLDQTQIDEEIEKKWSILSDTIKTREELKLLFDRYALSEDKARQLLKEREMSDRLISLLLTPRLTITKEEEEKYSARLKEQNKSLITYRLSLIKLEFEKEERESVIKEAYDLIRRLEGGESFKRMALRYSTDATAQNGGDAGFIDAHNLDPDVLQAIEANVVGKICGPVVFDRHLLIVKVADKLTPGEKLFREKYLKARQELLSELREKADITIHL